MTPSRKNLSVCERDERNVAVNVSASPCSFLLSVPFPMKWNELSPQFASRAVPQYISYAQRTCSATSGSGYG
jgi:hypothetical protein